MAEKRMFTQKIIDSDPFLDMPLSTQALYFHLNMRADDDGFINNPKRIQRTIGASEDDLKLLLAKRFVIGFENGVIVIKHWRMHNTLRKDRYNPTQYQEEMALLDVKDNNAYTEKVDGNLPATTWQPSGNQLEPQYSIDKNSIDKESTDKDSMLESYDSEPPAKPVRETTATIFKRLLPDYILSEELQARMAEWIAYKVERKEGYKEQGMKSLLRQVENNALKYGDRAVCELIELCMASGWKGIIFDKLEKQPSRQGYQKQTKADELNSAYGMMSAWAERGE
jgi:hypothetical protein